jgi:nucleoside phosphorylase
MHSDMRPSRLVSPEAEAITEAAYKKFNPVITNHPDLQPINWSLIGAAAPILPSTPSADLPLADAVVITWADAEWTAMEHVFCSSGNAMSYASRNTGTWPGWQQYKKNLPSSPNAEWTYWGYYRLVQLGSKNILLFKSNTHLDFPGPSFLTQLIARIIQTAKPSLIISIGTAGGTIVTDHVGTVNTVHAGTLYSSSQPESDWTTYTNAWIAAWDILTKPAFKQLLVPIPTTAEDIASVVTQFNAFFKTNYANADLNINNLDLGDPVPIIKNMTGSNTALLTATGFVVGTSDGKLKDFACVEMDDAIIAEACQGTRAQFGFIRNISDPVQNAALPSKVQGDWGSAIYNAYGFYTSYNGALSAWAILNA